jgi:hypothetical protein
MSLFLKLPAEIRGLIYENLITNKPKKIVRSHVLATAVWVNGSVPTSFLLVSKTFTDELIVMVTLLRHVRVEAGSVYDSLNSIVTSWPHVMAYCTRHLSVHICNTLDVKSRMHWRHEYIQAPECTTLRKIIFLVNESLASALNVLEITLDLPEVEPVQNMLQHIIAIVAEGKADTARFKDRWNGWLCQRIVFVRKRDEGQLWVKVSVRFRA